MRNSTHFLLYLAVGSGIIKVLYVACRKAVAMTRFRKWLPVALGLVCAIAAGVWYVVSGGRNTGFAIERQNKGAVDGEKDRETLSTGCDPEDPVQNRTAGGEGISPDPEVVTYCVYCCGQVRQEGVYRLDEGARVDDAIRAAGGFTEDADTAYWNLAMPVTDAMKIYVPSLEETQTGAVIPELQTDPGGSGSTDPGPVNINTADVKLLMTLPGIGEQRAKDIIEYREKHGGFAEIRDIMKVSGIKDAMFEKLRDRICVR